jgi:hypothetical protein
MPLFVHVFVSDVYADVFSLVASFEMRTQTGMLGSLKDHLHQNLETPRDPRKYPNPSPIQKGPMGQGLVLRLLVGFWRTVVGPLLAVALANLEVAGNGTPIGIHSANVVSRRYPLSWYTGAYL